MILFIPAIIGQRSEEKKEFDQKIYEIKMELEKVRELKKNLNYYDLAL